MNNNNLIVGIGASAGGLEALETFFKAMPDNSNIAFIVVVHLDPTHISLLPELLQRHTKMEVIKISDGMRVKANKIYVIPPSHHLSILNGELQLIEPLNLRAKLPIDYFFRNLAQDQGGHAACIILSGTGSDGSLGLKEIKAEAGMVMVQSLASAKYDGMPQSAIATGMADYILAPEDMPEQLKLYFQHSQSTELAVENNIKSLHNSLHKILILIRNQTGHDFSLYKKNTIIRRIERRMHVHQLKDIQDYLAFAQKNEQEISILFRELLIGVTRFFRDKEAFETLKNAILPQLLNNKPDNYAIRVWVPGCSSGEEAYSIAILLQECLLALKKNMTVQIFGTDIDEYAIAQARSGLYPINISDDVSAEYCQRYFIKKENQYRIKKSIRETLVFAIQNLIKDPPFTKLDLICCRNLLIYFGPELQKKILPIFHYSLKNDGILFLGSSETTGQSNHYFEILDKKWKIFKRRPQQDIIKSALHFSDNKSTLEMAENHPLSSISQLEELSALQLVESILKQSKVEPCAIIDNQQNIIYVHGCLGDYLEPAQGRVSNRILDMARSPALKNELAISIRKVALHKKEVHKKAIAIKHNSNETLIDLSITPLQDIGSLKDLMMVTFIKESIPTTPQTLATKNTPLAPAQGDTSSLRQELESTRENLQSTIEELETSNEELKSSNEELQSTNEELQSTNEELETSKEELQSLNEESITVNAELRSHIDELSSINDDIKNLLDSTQIATIFLDTELKIRRYTPKMIGIINLVATDINRPIGHLASTLQNIKLADAAEQVLKTLDKIETEVHDDQNNIYRMRILPYRTTKNVIDGVVISFEEITALKHIETALREREQRYKSLFDHCPIAIVEVDISALAKYVEQHHLTDLETLNKFCSDNPSEIEKIRGLIKLLNINKYGLLLFTSEHKQALLNKLPQLFEQDDFLYQQLQLIVEKNDSRVFHTTIKTLKNKHVACEITITIPLVDKRLNFASTILVISPRNHNLDNKGDSL